MNKFQKFVAAFELTTPGNYGVTKRYESGTVNGYSLDELNANFITIAHNIMPELMAELTRLQSFEAEVNSKAVNDQALFHESVKLLRGYGLQALDTLVKVLPNTSDQAHFQSRADNVRIFLNKIRNMQQPVVDEAIINPSGNSITLGELQEPHKLVCDTSNQDFREVIEVFNNSEVFSKDGLDRISKAALDVEMQLSLMTNEFPIQKPDTGETSIKSCDNSIIQRELNELKTAYESTSQGYWVVDDHGRYVMDTSTVYAYEVVEAINLGSPFSEEECLNTLVFIATAHNKLPLLFKELDRLYEIEYEFDRLGESESDTQEELFLMKNELSNEKNSI